MGSADVVPGVSGGTMALILGIYEELIRSVRSIDIRFFRRLAAGRLRDAAAAVAWPFLFALGAGILTAILTLARGISWALVHHAVLIWSFFFGLVLASVWSVGKELNRWDPTAVLWALLGGASAYWIVGLVPVETPNAAWFLFLSGSVAICAMILPGISGSFILVLLGKYHYVLDAVNQRDLASLIVFAAGAAVGLLSFVRLLNWLLERYRDPTLALLAGLMVGSLRKIWPWKTAAAGMLPVNVFPASFDSEVAAAVGLMVAGIAAVCLMNAAAGRIKNRS
ncbi:MAG: DUF368 domain-containing protein [Desulfobacterales bacterium]